MGGATGRLEGRGGEARILTPQVSQQVAELLALVTLPLPLSSSLEGTVTCALLAPGHIIFLSWAFHHFHHDLVNSP